MPVSNPRIQSIFYSNPDYYPPIINGSHVLHSAGYRQQMLCREYREITGIEYPKSLELERVHTTSKKNIIEYLNFMSKARQWGRQDTLAFIGHDMHGFMIARLLGWRFRRPVIYHCHDFVDEATPLGLGGSLVKRFEHHFAKTSDLVIVPDRERASVMVKQLRLRQFPEIVANAPLHLPVEMDNGLTRTLQNKGYQFEKVIFRQGSIGQGHCLEVTIKSIPFWKSDNWGFVVMGLGEDEYKERLYALANELGVSDRVVILPPVKYTEVLKYTIGADLGHGLYEPSHINNQYISTASNKIMEYIAVGIPVLLSDNVSSRSFLTRHKVGITANIDSPEAIADAINGVLDDPKALNCFAQNGKESFEKEFRYDRQYKKILAFLQSLN